MQRALLQWFRPDKKKLVIEALKKAGREDLIGYGPKCLVRPYGDDRAMPHGKSGGGKKPSAAQTGGRRNDAPRGGRVGTFLRFEEKALCEALFSRLSFK